MLYPLCFSKMVYSGSELKKKKRRRNKHFIIMFTKTTTFISSNNISIAVLIGVAMHLCVCCPSSLPHSLSSPF